MCGISGFVDTGRRQDDRELRATVLRMANAIRHRGPDDVGTWEDAAARWPSATADFRFWIFLPWGISQCGPRAVAM